jgi:hypothetical protein
MIQEPTTRLLSEMEGIPGIWDQETKKMGIRIQRNSIHEYNTPDFNEAARMWNDWRTFGFSEHGGSNDQGGLYMDILRVMASCDEEYQGA